MVIIIAKAIRYGYLPRSFSTLDELREDCGVMNNCFSLPECKNTNYNLRKPRKRTHNLTLPMDVNAVMKQNFLLGRPGGLIECS